MKRILRLKTAARAVLLFLLLGGFALPSALAQTTTPVSGEEDHWEYAYVTSSDVTLYFKYNSTATGLLVTYPHNFTAGNPADAWTGYTKPNISNLAIPEQIWVSYEGYKTIVGIDDYAFYGCEDLKNAITLPNTVTSIGDEAFNGCVGLKNVNSVAVTSIGEKAFYGCTDLAWEIDLWGANIGAQAFVGTKITSLKLMGTGNVVGAQAFKDCTSLVTVTFGTGTYGITSIGNEAFMNCTGLKGSWTEADQELGTPAHYSSLDIRSGTIGARAFKGCTSLGNIDGATPYGIFLGAYVAAIGNEAFSGCVNVKVLDYYATNCTYNYDSSDPKSAFDGVGSSVAGGCDLWIPANEGILVIPAYLFYGCTTLVCKDVDGNPTNTSIDDKTTIGDYAFYGCTGLSGRLTVGNRSNTRIGQYAFYGCSGLTELQLGEGITSIGNNAFANCTGLTKIYYFVPNLSYSLNLSPFSNSGSTTSGCTLYIDDDVQSIPQCMFYGCSKLTGTLTIPSGIRSIGKNAFSSTGFASLVYNAANCTNGGGNSSPFQGIGSSSGGSGSGGSSTPSCEFSIGSSVQSIPQYMFSGCSALTGVNGEGQLVIPSSVRSIDMGAFQYCSSLQKVTYAANTNITSIDKNTYLSCSNLQEVRLSTSIRSIGDQAFNGCSNLTAVYSPSMTPPSLSTNNAFPRSKAAKKAYVPVCAKPAYNSSSWKTAYSFTVQEDDAASGECYNTFTGAEDELWSNPNNWSKGTVPVAGEYVLIDEICHVDVNTPALAEVVVNDNQGHLAIDQNKTLTTTTFENNKNVNIHGTLQATTVVNNGANFRIEEGGTCNVSNTLTNNGTMYGDVTGYSISSGSGSGGTTSSVSGVRQMINNGTFTGTVNSGTTFVNNAGATFTINGPSNLSAPSSSATNTIPFSNSGTLNINSSLDASAINSVGGSSILAIANAGDVDIEDVYLREGAPMTISGSSQVEVGEMHIQNSNITVTGGATLYASGKIETLTGSSSSETSTGTITIGSGSKVSAMDDMSTNITVNIQDGGQLVHNTSGIKGTLEKDVEASTSGSPRWYTISSPYTTNYPVYQVSETLHGTYTIASVYEFDQSKHLEWRYLASGANDATYIKPGRGYIYSSDDSGDPDVNFHNNAGTEYVLQPSNVNIEVELQRVSSVTPLEDGANEQNAPQDKDYLVGWNFVGNPFPCNAYINKPFYKMDNSGSFGNHNTDYQLDPTLTASFISPCEAVFVIAETDGEKVKFSRNVQSEPVTSSNDNLGFIVLTMEKAAMRGMARVDKAIVSFNENDRLPKLVLNPDNARLYIPQDGKDYAIAYSDKQGVLPVNFLPNEDGNYTINVKTEEAEFSYLHLIDNMTGADVDLLANPTYSFESTLGDYPSRFKLVFSAGSAFDDEEANATFAFYDGSEWILATDGNAIVQLVDLMGRVLVSNKGAHTVSTNGMAPGVYVLRLIQGDNVKTQKIVVR